MLDDIVYCIDTSALIDLKRLYPSDVFPTLWEKLSDMVKQGRLIAPHEVLKEIEKRDDELLAWVKGWRKMFRKLNQEQIQVVHEIVHKFPDWIDPDKETPEADPFVVALAIVENQTAKRSFFVRRGIVVTQERLSRGSKMRIPNVCQHYGVECIDITQLFRSEKWHF